MNVYRSCPFGWLLALTFVFSRPASAADGILTIDELREMITNQWEQVQSIQGSYYQEALPDAEAQANQLMRDRITKTEVIFAWSGKKRLISDYTEMFGKNMELLKLRSKSVFDGTEFRQRVSKSFLIQRERSHSIDTNAYLGCLRRPLNDEQLAAAIDHPAETTVLPYCLQSNLWSIRPAGGNFVEVFSEKRRMVFDPEQGYCLVRLAEEHSPPKSDQPRFTRTSFEFKKHRKVWGELHLPMEIVGQIHFTTPAGKPAGTLTNHLVVTSLSLNQVKDGVFRLEPEVGDYVMDRIRDRTYEYSGRNALALNRAADRASSENKRVRSRVAIFVAAFCLGLCGVYAAVRLLGRLRGRTARVGN